MHAADGLDSMQRRVGWRTDGASRLAYNRPMTTSAIPERRSEAEASTLAAALWVLAATAWFVMAVLFIRHGVFSASILLLTALICLPGLRSAFRHLTGIRVSSLVTAAAVIALALGGLISAARHADSQQSRQLGPSAAGEATGESNVRTGALEPANAEGSTSGGSETMAVSGP